MANIFKSRYILLNKGLVDTTGTNLYVNGIIAGSGIFQPTGDYGLNNTIAATGSAAIQYSNSIGTATSGTIVLTGTAAVNHANSIGSIISGNLTQTGITLGLKIDSLSGTLVQSGAILSAVKVTGSSIINIANFTGLGGTIVLYSGNQIFISGGATSSSNGITGLIGGTGIAVINNLDGTFTINSTVSGGGGITLAQLNSLSGYTNSTFVRLTGIDYISGQKIFADNVTITGNLSNGLENGVIGIYSHAEGSGTIASGQYSHTEGFGTKTTGDFSHAEGSGTFAFGKYSHAEGIDVMASGIGSHAEGDKTKAFGDFSHAEGYRTTAIGTWSSARGETTKASAMASHAEGIDSIASGTHSHAEGEGTNTFGFTAHSEGMNSTARGRASHSEGYATSAYAFASHAEGESTKASGSSAHSEGYLTVASAGYSHAEGQFTRSYGTSSHAEGSESLSYGIASHAEGWTTNSSGDYSHAEGGLTQTTGWYSHAEGVATRAYGDASHSEGYNTISSGYGSHAEGNNTTTFINYSHAEGNFSNAYGLASHAEGNYTIASGIGSHAEGSLTKATGNYSHAEGTGTFARGTFSHTEGFETIAAGNSAHAEGAGASAAGDYSHAEGSYSFISAAGSFSHAEGVSTISRGYGAHVEGGFTYATGRYSHAEGDSSSAYGEASHAEGYSTYAIGLRSHAEGESTIASGRGSHAEGYLTISSGDYSHAEGQLSRTSGQASHAEGYNTFSSGFASHAEGEISVSIGYASHAEGYNTKAYFNYDHAEGESTIASGSSSHAEGHASSSKGYASHAEGEGTTTVGYGAHSEGAYTFAGNYGTHAEGYTTKAYGNSSHAEGSLTIASGDQSHTEGLYTVTFGTSSHAEGEYSIAVGRASHAEGYKTITSGGYSHTIGQETTTEASYSFAAGRFNRQGVSGLFQVGRGADANTRGDVIFVHYDSTGWNKLSGQWEVQTGFLIGGNKVLTGIVAGSNITVINNNDGTFTIASAGGAGGNGDGINLSGNLTQTGIILFNDINSVGQTLSGKLTQSGQQFVLISGDQYIYDQKAFKGSGHIEVGVDIPPLPYNPFMMAASGDYYVQANFTNKATGLNSSIDLVFTSATGTDTQGYLDIGLNNPGYNVGEFNLSSGEDGYVQINGGNLVIGTLTNHRIIFHTDGGALEDFRAAIDDTGILLPATGQIRIGDSKTGSWMDQDSIHFGISEISGVGLNRKSILSISDTGWGNTYFQAAPWNRSIKYFAPNNAATQTLYGDSAANVGTLLYTTSEVLSDYTQVTPAAGLSAGLSANNASIYRGSTLGNNGFFFTCKFILNTVWASGLNTSVYGAPSGCRIFVGLTDQAVATQVGLNEPAGNMIGLNYMWASGGAVGTGQYMQNWAIRTRDNVATSTGNTAMTFQTGFYRFSMNCEPYPNNNFVYWELTDLIRNSGVNGVVTANLPVGSTAMRPMVALGFVSGIKVIGSPILYVEKPLSKIG